MGRIERTPQFEEIVSEDGILCSILSSLTLVEAARTCVLSPRWRYIWTRLPKLEFDAVNVLGPRNLEGVSRDGEDAYRATKGKASRFIRSVDSVLRQYQGSRLDVFAVRFFLDNTHSQHLDAWLRFAVEHNTKFLRLNLFRPYTTCPVQPYQIPSHLFESTSSIERLSLILCSFKLPLHFRGLTHLQEFNLCEVYLDKQDFYRILSNCSSNLQRLVLWWDYLWDSLSVPHPLSQLQNLTVKHCHKLRKIEVDAVNLQNFSYEGFPVDLIFRQSSRLTNANICLETENTPHNLHLYLTKLSTSLPLLHSLTLKLTGDSKVSDLPQVSSSFKHLKHLDCHWNVGVKMTLLHLATLLDAAPFLENLALHLQLSTRVKDEPPEAPSKLREMLPTRPHSHLKIIEVDGFYYNTWQIEIVVYLLKNAPGLQTLTLKEGSNPSWFVSKKRRQTAKRIFSQDPQNAKLAIL